MTKEELKEYCDDELKSIEKVISELFTIFSAEKSEYPLGERAAIATFIANVYSGIENILKQILMFDNLNVKDSATWHEELLKKAAELAILPRDLYQIFTRYLVFRNSLVHTYIFNIKLEELKVLASAIKDIIEKFKSEVDEYIQTI